MATSLSEFRQQYPQYDDIGDDELIRKARGRGVVLVKDGEPAPRGYGFGDAITQGFTFNLADEAAAAGGAVGGYLAGRGSLGENYDRVLAERRSARSDYAQESPSASLVGEFGGAIAGGLGVMGRVPVAPGLGGRVVQGAALGGGAGGAQAFGAAEGGPAERLSSAAIGTAVGGGVGGLVPVAGSLLGAGYRMGRNMFNMGQPQNEAARMAAKKLAQDQLSPDDLRTALAAAQPRQAPQAAPTGQTLPATVQQPGTAVAPATGGALPAVTGQLDDAARVAAGAGKPLTIADVAGPNTRRLARGAMSVPTEGSARATRFLDARQLDAPQRVMSDVRRALGSADFKGTLDDLAAQRAAAAKPLYDAAYSKPVPFTTRLQELLKRPSVKQALSRARRIAQDEGEDFNQFFVDGDALEAALRGRMGPNAQASIRAALDDVGVERVPDMRGWDYIKRGLDDIIERNTDPVTGKIVGEQGRAVVRLKNELLRELDDAVPEYGAARAAWGGRTQSMQAMQKGRDFLKGDVELTAEQVKKLSPSDREFFRLGVVREVREQADRAVDNANVARRIFGTQKKRDALRAAFPDQESFDDFARMMDLENNMAEVRNLMTGGSPTARIQAEQAELAGPLDEIVEGAATGGRQGMASAITRGLVNRARGITEDRADELARMLLSADEGEIARALAAIEEAAARAARPSAAPSLGGATVSGGAAVSSGVSARNRR